MSKERSQAEKDARKQLKESRRAVIREMDISLSELKQMIKDGRRLHMNGKSEELFTLWEDALNMAHRLLTDIRMKTSHKYMTGEDDDVS